MNQSAHKGAGGEYDGPADKSDLHPGIDSCGRVVYQVQTCHFRLLQVKVFLPLKHALHAQPVHLLVSLCPRCPDRWPFPGIQHTELDTGGIDILPHFAAESVDLPDDMPLCLSTDRRIAGHECDGVKIDGEEQRFAPHACRSEGSLASGVPSTDDDHVIFFVVYDHDAPLFHKRSLKNTVSHELLPCFRKFVCNVSRETSLFTDAKLPENQVEYIIGGRFSSYQANSVEGIA
jgi:hypothetical protein